MLMQCSTFGGAEGAQLSWLSMQWVAVFFVDFMSAWFKHFSLFIAGPRVHIVQNPIEQKILTPLNSRLGRILVQVLADLWLMQYFMIYSTKHADLVDGVQQPWFPVLLHVTGSVASFRIVTQVIELKQAWLRIIDLDCEEYNKRK